MNDREFEVETPRPPQPDAELQKLIDEQMCVVRSLASVAAAFTKKEVGLDLDVIHKRAADMNDLGAKADAELKSTLAELQKRGRQSSVLSTLQLLDQVTEKYASKDRLNIRRLVDSIVADESIATPLREGLKGIIARYKIAFSYGDVERALQNPNTQVCVVLPEHMAHIDMDEEGKIISLSDRDDKGKPIPLSDLMMLYFILGKQEHQKDNFNTVIFTREERVPQDDVNNFSVDFLTLSSGDRDYQTAVQQVRAQNGKVLYSPDPIKIKEGIYPEVETYRESSDPNGSLHPEEAVAAVYLARKAAVLTQSFGQSSELSNKVENLYQRKAQELGATNMPGQLWQYDVVEGISEVLRQLPLAAYVRETPPAEPVDEKKLNLQRLIRKRHMDLYHQPLQADQGSIGEHTVEAMVQDLHKRADDEIPRVPEGARTPEEVQARIASRKLGLTIAKDLYLKTINLHKS